MHQGSREPPITLFWSSSLLERQAIDQEDIGQSYHSGGGPLMIKSELAQRRALENSHLYQREIEKVINTVLDEISSALARGDRVELRGFGTFTVRRRSARTPRNPSTGDHVL